MKKFNVFTHYNLHAVTVMANDKKDAIRIAADFVKIGETMYGPETCVFEGANGEVWKRTEYDPIDKVYACRAARHCQVDMLA